MIVAVVGSRTFTDRDRLFAVLDALREEIGDFTVISGGAKGADQLAEEWARSRRAPLQIHPADWKTHGRAAGPIRNEEMIPKADRVVLFWDGRSRGAGHALEIAFQHRIPYRIHRFEPVEPESPQPRGGRQTTLPLE